MLLLVNSMILLLYYFFLYLYVHLFVHVFCSYTRVLKCFVGPFSILGRRHTLYPLPFLKTLDSSRKRRGRNLRNISTWYRSSRVSDPDCNEYAVPLDHRLKAAERTCTRLLCPSFFYMNCGFVSSSEALCPPLVGGVDDVVVTVIVVAIVVFIR